MRRRLQDEILKTAPVATGEWTTATPCAVCLMCCEGDWRQAIWALKSFYRNCANRFPLCIRLQGSVRPSTVDRIRFHFPAARIILQEQADHLAAEGLSAYPRLASLRRRTVHVQKLTDFYLGCDAERIFVLDSDILFFRQAEELEQAIQHSTEAVFQQDCTFAYVIGEDEAATAFGIRLKPRLNVGMMVFPRREFRFDLVEEWLGHPILEPHLKIPHIEQTLWALLGSRAESVRLLPSSYNLQLSGKVDMERVIARHYVTPVRELMFDEGFRYLKDSGFIRALARS